MQTMDVETPMEKSLSEAERSMQSLKRDVEELAVRIRAIFHIGHVFCIKVTDTATDKVHIVSPYDLLAGASAAATSIAKQSAKRCKHATKYPQLWAVHDLHAIPALAALHAQTEDCTYLIIAGHIVRVNSPTDKDNGRANYSQCILPACTEVYTVQKSVQLSSLEMKIAKQHLAQFQLGDFLVNNDSAIMPYFAALRALRFDFGADESKALETIAHLPIVGSVVRMFFVMFTRFNSVDVEDKLDKIRIAWIFASNFREKFNDAKTIETTKPSYPMFSEKMTKLQDKTAISFLRELEKQDTTNKPNYRKPAVMIMTGLGKMLLGIPNTVDLRVHNAFTNHFKQSEFKKTYDEKVRGVIFRDDSNDPLSNVTSMAAEIVGAMVFSETVRWPLQLIDVMCLMSLDMKSDGGPTLEDIFFSENRKKTEEGVQMSFSGPYIDLIKGSNWAGTFPMSHKGSVADAKQAMAYDMDDAHSRQLNPLLMKCMRLYANFFKERLHNPVELQPVFLSKEDTLQLAHNALKTTYKDLDVETSKMYVYQSLCTEFNKLANNSIDSDKSGAMPDIADIHKAKMQDMSRLLQGWGSHLRP